MTINDNVSRRNLLLASTGLAAGTLISMGRPEARKHRTTLPVSGLTTGRPVPLRYTSVPGFLSAEQLAPHFSGHYGGALRGYVTTDRKLASTDVSGTTIDASAFGALHRARTNKGNSVLLHELYFGGMALKQNDAKNEIRRAIVKRFGSVDKWRADFQACAKAAGGWAMLSYHSVSKKLYNVVCDKHATGVFWMSTPLLTIDVYEHAYYVDYKNNKGEYIRKFMNHIDWQVVNRRFKVASR